MIRRATTEDTKTYGDIDGTRSPEWSFFSTLTIRDENEEPYLIRWRIIDTPWFGIYIHKILQPDPGTDLHDHPWNFWSLILRGGYWERIFGETPMSPPEWRLRRWWSRKAATDAHRIDRLTGPSTWTLVFRGRRRRVWGFYTPQGWVPWTKYEAVLP